MRRLIAPYTFRVIITMAALALAAGAVALAPVWDWRPTDLRRIVVTLREASPIFAVLATVVALVNARPLEPHNIVVGLAPPRGRARVLARQVVVTGAALTAGVGLVLVPALLRASSASLSSWVALLSWAASLWLLVALAHAFAVVIPFPMAWVSTPLLALGSTIWLVIVNDGPLMDTGRSSLAASVTWGFLAPNGQWDFRLSIEAFRAAFFLLCAACALLAALAFTERSEMTKTRTLRAAAWLCAPVVLAVSVTWLSPRLLSPSLAEARCVTEGRFTGCVFQAHEPVLPDMASAGGDIVEQLPPDTSPIRIVESGLEANGAGVISESLPATREGYREEIAQAVAYEAVALRRCTASTPTSTELTQEQSAHLESAKLVASTLLQRAGHPASGHDALAVLSKSSFHDWWRTNRAAIESCRLTPRMLDA